MKHLNNFNMHTNAALVFIWTPKTLWRPTVLIFMLTRACLN